MENKRIIEAVFDKSAFYYQQQPGNQNTNTSTTTPAPASTSTSTSTTPAPSAPSTKPAPESEEGQKESLQIIKMYLSQKIEELFSSIPENDVSQELKSLLMAFKDKIKTASKINNNILVNKFGFIKNITLNNYLNKLSAQGMNQEQYIDAIIGIIDQHIQLINDYVKDPSISKDFLAELNSSKNEFNNLKRPEINESHTKIVNSISSKISTIINKLEESIFKIDGHISDFERILNNFQHSRNSNVIQQRKYYSDFIVPYRTRLKQLYDAYSRKLGEVNSLLSDSNLFNIESSNHKDIISYALFDNLKRLENNRTNIKKYFDDVIQFVKNTVGEIGIVIKDGSVTGKLHNYLFNNFVRDINPDVILNLQNRQQQFQGIQQQTGLNQEENTNTGKTPGKRVQQQTGLNQEDSKLLRSLITEVQKDNTASILNFLVEKGYLNRP